MKRIVALMIDENKQDKFQSYEGVGHYNDVKFIQCMYRSESEVLGDRDRAIAEIEKEIQSFGNPEMWFILDGDKLYVETKYKITSR